MVKSPLLSLEALKEIVTPFLPQKRSKTTHLNSRDRYRNAVEIRIIYAYMARSMNHTLTDIGKELNRDHTVVIYYLKQFENLIETCPEFQEKYLEINSYIKTIYPYESSIMDYADKIQYQPQSAVFSGFLPA